MINDSTIRDSHDSRFMKFKLYAVRHSYDLNSCDS